MSNKILKSKIWIILLIFFFVILFLKIINNKKVFLNITPSVKVGIYLMEEYDNLKNLKKGDYVIFPPPVQAVKRDYHNNFLKQVVANSNDIILVDNNQIFINGVFYGNIKEKDSFGNNIRTLEEGIYFLKEDEYFVMGEHFNSYDSRYFGSIKKNEIIYVGKLLIPFFWIN